MSIKDLACDKELLKSELISYGAVFTSDIAFRCPVHNDSNASGGIFNNNGHWRFKCHVCGDKFKGDIIDLYKLQGKHFTFGNNNSVKSPKDTAKRPLTIEQIHQIYLRQMPEGTVIDSQYDYKTVDGNVVFSVIRFQKPDGDKEIRQCSPLNGGWLCRGAAKPLVLYNLPQISKLDRVLLCEGEKKTSLVINLGIPATTTAEGAGKSKNSDLTILAGKSVCIWPDNDSIGRKHANEIADSLMKLNPPSKVSIIEPDDLDLLEYEDVGDYIEQLRIIGKTDENIKTEILKVMDNAAPVSPSGGLQAFLRQVANGQLQEKPMPFNVLSRLSRALLPKSICLICGTPGAGKTFFILQMILYWLENDIDFACYMLEEPIEHHLQRVLSLLEDAPEYLDMAWLKNNGDLSQAAYNRHRDVLDKLSTKITDIPDRQETYDGLLKWAKAKLSLGIKLLIIDPITAVEQSQSPWIEDCRFLMNLRALLVEFNATAIINIHPRKGQTYPCLDDIAGGAAWQRFSQSVLWIEHLREAKKENILTSCGQCQIQINRIIHICKGRNAPGVGNRIGFIFGGKSLLFAEQGLIINNNKKKKENKNDSEKSQDD